MQVKAQIVEQPDFWGKFAIGVDGFLLGPSLRDGEDASVVTDKAYFDQLFRILAANPRLNDGRKGYRIFAGPVKVKFSPHDQSFRVTLADGQPEVLHDDDVERHIGAHALGSLKFGLNQMVAEIGFFGVNGQLFSLIGYAQERNLAPWIEVTELKAKIHDGTAWRLSAQMTNDPSALNKFYEQIFSQPSQQHEVLEVRPGAGESPRKIQQFFDRGKSRVLDVSSTHVSAVQVLDRRTRGTPNALFQDTRAMIEAAQCSDADYANLRQHFSTAENRQAEGPHTLYQGGLRIDGANVDRRINLLHHNAPLHPQPIFQAPRRMRAQRF